MVIKVVLRDKDNALLRTKDSSILMLVDRALLSRRFRPGETEAFFDAGYGDGGTLEIRERLQRQNW